mmetsp:Transcript_8364/g.11699  ORF Transcript_8364/g.11699 Transcript_8364/m.11699 type:complete len:162 (+) Transcript_8364:29-514(+)
MSNRTAGIIDAEIDAIKVNNPNWLADIGDKALITALTVEKNQLAPPAQSEVRNENLDELRKDFNANTVNMLKIFEEIKDILKKDVPEPKEQSVEKYLPEVISVFCFPLQYCQTSPIEICKHGKNCTSSTLHSDLPLHWLRKFLCRDWVEWFPKSSSDMKEE